MSEHRAWWDCGWRLTSEQQAALDRHLEEMRHWTNEQYIAYWLPSGLINPDGSIPEKFLQPSKFHGLSEDDDDVIAPDAFHDPGDEQAR